MPSRRRLPPGWVRAAACLLLLVAGAAGAFEPFTIRQIRAEGLQRLDLGTVLTYLPLAVGDQVNQDSAAQGLRALYASGLFQDVRLDEDGSTLVIKLVERPQISSFKVEGNEKIGGDELKKSLKDVGLVEGELFKRDLLDQMTSELQRQYYANGYYAVDIETKVTNLPNNRVDVHVQVFEGKPARIKEINILGNKAFGEDELLDQLKLHKSSTLRPFQSNDKYSRQQLVGDLETLNSYYQDRGYLKFSIYNIQVELSPDKKDVYVTVNVQEGERYRVKSHRFSGDTVLNPAWLDALVGTHDGEIFSRKNATESADRVEAALSDIGYAFAKVNPQTDVDEKAKTVVINYTVDPGKRVYVRHISFAGGGSTQDYTFRREMRQLEAAPFSKTAVERSRTRLARLPFIEDVEVSTTPVPGTDDQVDVAFTMKQRAPGSVQFGVGFSGSQGLVLSAGVTHTNFLGTGNRVSFNLEESQIAKELDISWTNPYFTDEGISQSVSTFYRKAKAVVRFASGYDTDVLGAQLVYGVPLSEFTAFRLGVGASQTSVTTFANFSSNEILDYVIQHGSRYKEYQLITGLTRDTRNRTFFATRGMLDSISLNVNMPGSTLLYYSLATEHQQYIPLPAKFFLFIDAAGGLVQTFGKTRGTPPFENYFAGGPGTVRGFRYGTVGPRDSNGNPFGGVLRTTIQTNLVIPLPVPTDQKSTRLAVFFDTGNAYGHISQFAPGDFRRSYGVDIQWFTGIVGLLDVSYAIPIGRKPVDQIEHFQFNFGAGF